MVGLLSWWIYFVRRLVEDFQAADVTTVEQWKRLWGK